MTNSRLIIVICFLLLGIGSACSNHYAPKPRGYFRIKLPDKTYQTYRGGCPFTFDYPTYAALERDTIGNAHPCWMNVVYPLFNARIYLSYYPITSKQIFNELVEDARTFAFKHTVKATAIDEALITDDEQAVYGVLYSIEGNTASATQFFVTDSASKYLRGALYFHEKPRRDSIQPVLDFINRDIQVMIRTMRWK